MFYEFQHYGVSKAFSREDGKNFSFPMHLHQFFELITVVSGDMAVAVDACSYSLHQGESILIFPHQLHSLSSKTSEHILFIFSPELIGVYASKYAASIPASGKFTLRPQLLEQLESLREDSSLFEKKGFLYSVCADFDRNAEYKKRIHNEKSLLYHFFEFVEKNYKSDCSLHRLAEQLTFSYSYVSRYFKKLTGISYNEYVNQYRINKACHILTNSTCPVLECAYEVGYTSLRSFNRNFKQYTGMTPNEYRK